MSKVMVPLASIDLINNKLQQARTIALLVQGNSTTEAPLNDEYIDFALGTILDLVSDSYKALNGEVRHV